MSNSGFQPSVDAARAAMGGKITMEHRPHPTGSLGAKLSLDEVALRIHKGRLDPRVRAWAIRTLKEAGNPKSVKGQAQALLNGLRKAAIYVQDPVSAEFMQAAHETLCLDEHGLCFRGGDCDDLSVAYGSATGSIGIPTYVVGQSFDTSGVPSHVIVAVEDHRTGEQWRVDPSSSDYEVGKFFPATKEVWIDPFDKNGAKMPDGTVAGDFVGVGTLPQIGIGDITTEEQRKLIYDATTSQLQTAVFTLEKSVNSLRAALIQIESTRTLIRPDAPFDSDPTRAGQFIINGLSDFPPDGRWTKNMATISLQTLAIGETLVKAGHEALNGIRKVIVDPNTHEAYIESAIQDPWRIQTVLKTATDIVLGFYGLDGTFKSAATGKTGQVLTKEQVDKEAELAQGKIGNPVIIAAIVAAGVVLASVATYYIVARWCDYGAKSASMAVELELVKAVAAKTITAEQAVAIRQAQAQARVAESDADARNKNADPFSTTVSNISSIVKWMAVGGIVVAGVVVGAPLLKEAAESVAAKMKARRSGSTTLAKVVR